MASERQPLTQSFMRNSGEKVEDTYIVATKAISSITCARYKMHKAYTCACKSHMCLHVHGNIFASSLHP